MRKNLRKILITNDTWKEIRRQKDVNSTLKEYSQLKIKLMYEEDRNSYLNARGFKLIKTKIKPEIYSKKLNYPQFYLKLQQFKITRTVASILYTRLLYFDQKRYQCFLIGLVTLLPARLLSIFTHVIIRRLMVEIK